MSQRRSYPNSGDFNLDDLFRPEPAQGAPVPGQSGPPGQQPGPPPQGGEQPGAGREYPGGPAGPAVPQGTAWGEQPASYAAQAPVQQAPETQYLPPYPSNDPQPSYGGQQPFVAGQQQGFESYGGQQSFGGQQPGFAGPQQGYAGQQPSYGGRQSFDGPQSFEGGPQGAGYQPGPAEQTTRLGRTGSGGSGSSGGLSRKAVIGGLVGICVVGAILVGVLNSGGDQKPKKQQAKPPATSTAPSTGASGGASALSPEAQTQAGALSSLLGTANSSRQAVIGAVGAIKNCDNPAAAQTALTQAAAQRKQLLTSLAALKVDKLPTGQQLVDQLNQAWQASQSADEAYAAWAGDAVGGCDPAKQGDNQHRKDGDTASGQASTAKKQAATLWNAIATQAALPSLSESQL
ncbi:hypothetical protein C7C46_06345 [Streptomyces tateyamensis]|uniref:Uncharacterized protein n=1 Tax=Streptomyces tateyamensis TaxID=565073 RepID=A0A2V4NJ13_9ACTN|nr:hypothetical protein [Streptomyces tateyamensis]PYC85363.1 hypothetical protein C7C46_06345 [Streptomyces tateyamensis]